MGTYKPHPYQQKAENFIYEHTEAGLFLDMGLGKTVITLTALENLSWDIEKVLIIAPKRPAEDTWPEELEKWKHLKGLTYSLVLGDAQTRLRALNSPAYIYITNRENTAWIIDQYKNRRWPFDCLVIDELSSFKSPKAQRFRALKKVRPFIQRVIGLTGTPAGNGYLDLWAECYLLDRGKALGKTVTGYRDRYFTPGARNGHIVYEWILKDGAKDEILEKLKAFCVSMKTEDYLDLPERQDIPRSYKLSGKAMKKYKDLEKEKFLEVQGKDIDAVNAAALMTKLLQISSGAVYDDSGEPVFVHDDKLEALDALLEEAEGENVLVFYAFKHERDRLKERYPFAKDVKEPGAVKEWKAGKLKMLLAHPASAGHGLNLQSGGAVSIWFGLTMSLELYQQAVKRLHRQGQTKPVRNYVLLAKGTYEEIVYYRILQEKEKAQSIIMEALKQRGII